jgi:5'-3' exonuclease
MHAAPAHQNTVKRVACSWQALKGAGVEFIVAPYEADAQMAYLALNGKVHAVRTA